MAVTTAVATVVAAGAGIRQSQIQQDIARRQNRAQRRARDVEIRQAEIQNQRARNRAIAEQRRIRAANIVSGDQGNISGSSALTGVLTGQQTALSSAIGFQSTQLAANNARSSILQNASDASVRLGAVAGNFQAISSLAGSVGALANGPTFNTSST